MSGQLIPTGKRAIDAAKLMSFEGNRIRNQWRTANIRVPGLERGKWPFFKGDSVVCVDGLFKGKSGEIESLDVKEGTVVVKGINVFGFH